MQPLVAPSLLSADFGRLADEIRALESAGADWLHFDVMDGRFVPNLTVGPLLVAAARRVTELPLDVHLMIVEPERLLADFVAAGASSLTVHAEACPHLQRTLAEIRRLGARAGLAFNPATPPLPVSYVADDLDLVLCMSVNPGFGGQTFLPGALAKVRQVRQLLDDAGRPQVPIEVDGGVGPANADALASAGCRVFVAGTAVFGSPPYAAAIAAIRRAAEGASGPG
ncbi:MAG: ribulose-phosphate 3-epimerase [Deltaproteobacteria bacterium]|nr:ribulose-phosphate 3-epimerase [Deltaproteobacteria bacterium]